MEEQGFYLVSLAFVNRLTDRSEVTEAGQKGLKGLWPGPSKGFWLGAGITMIVIVIFQIWRTGDVPEVRATRVTRRDLSTWVTSNGKVEPIAPHVIEARVTTFVRKVFVKEGAAVKRGQRLLTLDDDDVQARLAKARGDLLSAKEELRAARSGGPPDETAQLAADIKRSDAELSQLRREAESLRRLVKKQAATREEVDRNAVALQRAEAQQRLLETKRADLQRRARLDIKRAALAATRAREVISSLEGQLKSTEVTAPVDGTVYTVPVRTGQLVHPGDVLVKVADLRQLRIRAYIDEPELGFVTLGQIVEIKWDGLPGRSWSSRTVQVPKSVEPLGGRSVGEVLCSVDNADLKLLPNINVDVRIRVQRRTHVLAVPRGAVRVDGADRYVFVIKDDHLMRQAVKTGISSSGDYEVLEGLSENDVVALPGDTELHDGMAVRGVSR